MYEINRNFRNEGIDAIHQPEFTMLEFYQAYSNYLALMDLTEKLLGELVEKVCGTTKVPYGEQEINFGRFERLSMREAICKYWPAEAGNAPTAAELAQKDGARAVAKRYNSTALSRGIELIGGAETRSDGELTGDLFEAVAEEHVIQPTFIYDFPTEISPLSKCKEDDPSLVERFELFVAGMELANGFSELNDAEDQGAAVFARRWKKEGGQEGAQGSGRGLHPRAGARPAADGRRGHRHRPARDAADEFAGHPRGGAVSAAPSGNGRAGIGRDSCRRGTTGRGTTTRATRAKDQMKFEWLVALRYLRSPNRPAVLRLVTLLAVLGVAAGVMTLVIALAMDTGFRQAIRDRLLGVTAHVNLKPLDPEGIHDYRGLMARLGNTPGVQSMEPAVYNTVLLSTGGHAVGVVLKGVDPALEIQASGALRHMTAGSNDLDPGAGEIPVLLVGHVLADDLKISAGDYVNLIQPAGEFDSFRDAAQVAAVSGGRDFRFRLLRLRRQLGIRVAGLGPVPRCRRGRSEPAGSARCEPGRCERGSG